jgi:hypothetical protein
LTAVRANNLPFFWPAVVMWAIYMCRDTLACRLLSGEALQPL